MKNLIFTLTFSLLFVAVSAQVPEQPKPARLVNDLANVLDDGFEKQLESELVAFNDTTSNQIALVTLSSLNGMDPSMMANQIGEKWGVGQKDLANGVVILYKPKTAESRGQIFIAPGKGLEGAIPDATANRIIDSEMIPLFKQKKIEQGLYNGISIVKRLAAGEITAQGYAKQSRKIDDYAPIFVPLIFLLSFILVVVSKVRRARRYSLGHDVSFWTALFLANAATRRHGGHFSNFSSGGGSFGGGGGFSGFGGGGFGGGGAGGSW